MDIASIAIYLPFVNAVLYGLYYALLQESYGALSLATILLTNGVLFVVTALTMYWFKWDKVSLAPLQTPKMLWVFVAVIIVSTILHVTRYVALKNTSATYMAFAELSYPMFVPLFAYFLFARSEMTGSIALGGSLILLGSAIIIRR